MNLVFICGPMKSGKSQELIARTAPFEFANKKVLYIQPNHNVRDAGITSRSGTSKNALKVSSFNEVKQSFDVIGVDELHMFDSSDISLVEAWVKAGKIVILSGLDLDYRATTPPIIQMLYQLNPDEIIRKKAVCEVCKVYNARFTQILDHKEPLLDGFDSLVPEDGRFEYQARCRGCFVRK